MLNAQTLKKGGRYNWKGQPERLEYIGLCEPRNGRWHQFEKVDEPGKVWCEVLASDLHMLEETPPTAGAKAGPPWCCPKGEAANVAMCPECAEACAGYQQAMAPGVVVDRHQTFSQQTPMGESKPE